MIPKCNINISRLKQLKPISQAYQEYRGYDWKIISIVGESYYCIDIVDKTTGKHYETYLFDTGHLTYRKRITDCIDMMIDDEHDKY